MWVLAICGSVTAVIICRGPARAPHQGPEGPQPVDSGAPAGQELERGSPCARNKSWRGTEICGRGGL